jgi:hypothetical protein
MKNVVSGLLHNRTVFKSFNNNITSLIFFLIYDQIVQNMKDVIWLVDIAVIVDNPRVSF